MKEKVLALLISRQGDPLSGEEMSRSLGVSRAAVWKAIDTLRTDGCEIEAAPRRGYRLIHVPDLLTEGTILPYLSAERSAPIVCLDSIDSTNNYAKSIAMKNGTDGTAVVADEQTGGRGRQGRSFLSPKGKGIYLTLLYKPAVPPARAVSLTACAAVAVCDGIENACGTRPGIKWTNDIVMNGKKLAGILTEMSIEGETGMLQYVVTGIGINITQEPSEFPPEVRSIATSLSWEIGHPVTRGRVCACLIDSLDNAYRKWLSGSSNYQTRYRADCLTIGKPVRIIRPDGTREAFAESLDDDLGLIVRYPDGTRETVTAGEVSVRGLWGYN